MHYEWDQCDIDIAPILKTCPFTYARFREAGSDIDDALILTLTALLPPTKLGRAVTHLYAKPEEFKQNNPVGRQLRLGMQAIGEKTWGDLQATPGWSD